MTHFGCLIAKDAFDIIDHNPNLRSWIVKHCDRYICEMFGEHLKIMREHTTPFFFDGDSFLTECIPKREGLLRKESCLNESYDENSKILAESYLEWFKNHRDRLCHESKGTLGELLDGMMRVVDIYVGMRSEGTLGLYKVYDGIIMCIEESIITDDPIVGMRSFLETYGSDENLYIHARMKRLDINTPVSDPGKPMYHRICR